MQQANGKSLKLPNYPTTTTVLSKAEAICFGLFIIRSCSLFEILREKMHIFLLKTNSKSPTIQTHFFKRNKINLCTDFLHNAHDYFALKESHTKAFRKIRFTSHNDQMSFLPWDMCFFKYSSSFWNIPPII